MRPRLLLPLTLLAALTAVPGCGDDQDPEGAMELWERIHEDGYQGWARAPGYETRQPSNASHGDEVEIFVNPVIADVLAAGQPITSWPVGSLIVKDGFSGGDADLVAAMEKRDGGWFWAEWDAEGDASYSGNPDICTDCHRSGVDMVRAFDFPN